MSSKDKRWCATVAWALIVDAEDDPGGWVAISEIRRVVESLAAVIPPEARPRIVRVVTHTRHVPDHCETPEEAHDAIGEQFPFE